MISQGAPDVIMRDAGPRRVSRATTPPVDGVLALLDAEPANVTFPLVGAFFRAALGWSRVMLELHGPVGVGKTRLARLLLWFFDGVTCEVEPVVVYQGIRSRRDFSWCNGIRSGAVRPDGEVHNTFVPPKVAASLVITGPDTFDGLPLPEHLFLNMQALGTDLEELSARARLGEFAAFMESFIRWESSRIARGPGALARLDSGAAHDGAFGPVDPATFLQLRQCMRGVRELLAFLSACGVPETVIAHHRGRVWAALREVAAQQTP